MHKQAELAAVRLPSALLLVPACLIGFSMTRTRTGLRSTPFAGIRRLRRLDLARCLSRLPRLRRLP